MGETHKKMCRKCVKPCTWMSSPKAEVSWASRRGSFQRDIREPHRHIPLAPAITLAQCQGWVPAVDIFLDPTETLRWQNPECSWGPTYSELPVLTPVTWNKSIATACYLSLSTSVWILPILLPTSWKLALVSQPGSTPSPSSLNHLPQNYFQLIFLFQGLLVGVPTLRQVLSLLFTNLLEFFYILIKAKTTHDPFGPVFVCGQ